MGGRESNFVFALGFLCKCMRNKSRLAVILFLCRANLPRFDTRIWPHFHVKAHKAPLFNTQMGPLQLAVTWYKIRHAREQAVHWDIQNKATSQDKFAFSLFWMSQCVACSPAWWILYHVTASCKGPIGMSTAFFNL